MIVLLPELAVLGLALLVAILGLGPVRPRWMGVIAPLGLSAITGVLVGQLAAGVMGNVGILQADVFAGFFRVLILIAGIGATTLSIEDEAIETSLLLTSIAGALLIALATDIAALAIGLEILWIPLIARLARRSKEGGTKILLFGATSSGLLLFGLTLLFGIAGSTSYATLASSLAEAEPSGVLLLAGALVLSGLAIRIGVVPFHGWLPDAWESSRRGSLVILLQVGGFTALARLLIVALPALRAESVPILATLALMSALLASVLAIGQTSLKRLFGYAASAAAGFLLLGLVSTGHPESAPEAMAALMLGLCTWTAAGLGLSAFAGAHEDLEHYRGLFGRAPLLAMGLLLMLLTIVGFPPSGGFWAMLMLFKSLLSYAAASQQLGYMTLLVPIILAVPLLFFGLWRVPRAMATRPGDAEWVMASSHQAVVLGATLVLVAIFLQPDWLRTTALGALQAF